MEAALVQGCTLTLHFMFSVAVAGTSLKGPPAPIFLDWRERCSRAACWGPLMLMFGLARTEA